MKDFLKKYPASRMFVLWLLVAVISATFRALDVYTPSSAIDIQFFFCRKSGNQCNFCCVFADCDRCYLFLLEIV